MALLATGAPLASIAALASIDLRPGVAWHGRPLPLRLRLGGARRDLPAAGIFLCVLWRVWHSRPCTSSSALRLLASAQCDLPAAGLFLFVLAAHGTAGHFLFVFGSAKARPPLLFSVPLLRVAFSAAVSGQGAAAARSCKELSPTRSRRQGAIAGASRGQGAAAAVDAEVGEQGDAEEEELLAEERGRVVWRGCGRGLLWTTPARRRRAWRPLPRHRGLESHRRHLAAARAPGGGNKIKDCWLSILFTHIISQQQHTPKKQCLWVQVAGPARPPGLTPPLVFAARRRRCSCRARSASRPCAPRPPA